METIVANSSETLCAATVKLPLSHPANVLASPDQASPTLRPSDKSRKATLIESVLAEGDELNRSAESYNKEFVVRGNKALYELLSSIYGYALRIHDSDLMEVIIERMNKQLKEKHGIKTTSQTTWLTTVVKFVIRGTDRQTASNYSRVLNVAFNEDLAPNELADYIERRGGISKIFDIERVAMEKETAAKIASETREERIELMRESLLAKSYLSQTQFMYDGEVFQIPAKAGNDPAQESATKGSTFRVFLALEDMGKVFHVVTSVDLPKAVEDTILKHMSADLDSDLNKLKADVEFHKDQKRKWQDENYAARTTA